MNRRLALFIVLLFARSSLAQLSPVEREIATYVDSHNEEAIDLLARSVDINSGSMNFEGVREVGRLFGEELASLGFETRWSDGAEWGRAGHLIAEREGGAPHVLLIGHLDTVFEPDSPFQEYARVDESTAAGPGIIDMKGGNVIIIQALKALESAGALDDLHVTVVLHGDEEKSGRPISAARRDIIAAAEAADIALAFEPGDGDPRTAVIARRGWTGWTLEVRARPAHSSQIFQPSVGAGAAYEMARSLAEMYEELSTEKYLTLNAGLVLAGTDVEHDADQDRGAASGKSNVIPEHAVVSGDLRAISPEQLERAKERMREIAGRNLPHTTAEIAFDDSYPPMAPTDGNETLLRHYDKVSRDLGMGTVTAANPLFAGAADVSFVAGRVEMAIDGLGLMGSGSHTIREEADLKTLPSQTKRAAILLYRLIAR